MQTTQSTVFTAAATVSGHRQAGLATDSGLAYPKTATRQCELMPTGKLHVQSVQAATKHVQILKHRRQLASQAQGSRSASMI